MTSRPMLSLSNLSRNGFPVLSVMLASVAISASGPVHGAELRLGDKPYNYTVIDQDLRDVLHQFGSNMHLRVELSDAVKGRVRGRMTTDSPRRFLEAVAANYGLDWYYDGFKLYVTASNEDVSKFISLPRDLSEALKSALSSGGISDSRFPLRALAGTDSVIVSGPPHFVDLVEQAVSALVPPKSADASPSSVTVYRGAGVQKSDFPKAAPAVQ